MKPLTAVIAYHPADVQAVQKLMNWLQSLGGAPKHGCLLYGDQRVELKIRQDLKEQAKSLFRDVLALGHAITAPPPEGTPLEKRHWGANQVFLGAANVMRATFKTPWFWLEPDCIPFRRDWMDYLADGYETCLRRYMGAIVNTDPRINRADMPPKFLAGCAVYPNDAALDLKDFCAGKLAWDIASWQSIIPKASNTDLIQHHWGTAELPPTFHEKHEETDAHNVLTLDFLNPKSVVFHRCKDGTLIDLLLEECAATGKLPGEPRRAQRKPNPKSGSVQEPVAA